MRCSTTAPVVGKWYRRLKTPRKVSSAASLAAACPPPALVTEMPAIGDGNRALCVVPQPPLKRPATWVEEKPTIEATNPLPTSGMLQMLGTGDDDP